MERLTNENNQISQSSLFDYISVVVSNEAYIEPRFLNTFPHFVKALSNKYTLNMSRTATPITFQRLAVLHIIFLAMHNTKVMSYLFKSSTLLTVPNFFIAPLLKLATKSVTNNKVSGFTSGILQNSVSLEGFVLQFLNTSLQEWRSSFADSEFLSVIDSDFKLYRIKLDILNILQANGYPIDKVTYLKVRENFLLAGNSERTAFGPRTKEDSENDSLTSSLDLQDLKPIIGILQDTDFETIADIVQQTSFLFPGIFKYPDKVSYFKGQIAFQEINDLSIYRFRHTSDSDVYIAQQSMVGKVSTVTLDLYACFLKIFSPTFRHTSSIIAGDLTISVENTSMLNSWECYLNYEITSDRSPTSGTRKIPRTKTPVRGTTTTSVSESGVEFRERFSGIRNISTTPSRARFFATGRTGQLCMTLSNIAYNPGLHYTLRRSYHASTVLSVDPILPVIVKVLGGKGATYSSLAVAKTTPTAMYPGIHPISYAWSYAQALAHGYFNSGVWYFGLSTLCIAVLAGGFYTGLCYQKDISFLTALYNQITEAENFAYVVKLQLMYQDLNVFNQGAVIRIHAKAHSALTMSQCEILVKHFIYIKTPEVLGIAIDVTNPSSLIA